MKILILHNAYQQAGGEDAVVAAEHTLLLDAGHDVTLAKLSNDTIGGTRSKISALLGAPYSQTSQKLVSRLVQDLNVDVVHVHNFFPLLSPAVHQAAAELGVGVVQTLHNYRLLCANGLFLRDGSTCEKCLGGNLVWGAIHRCYRGSLPGSAAVVAMQLRARYSGVWHRHVHRFIALSSFARDKFIEGGLPADRLVVKGNFVRDDGTTPDIARSGGLYVGRLSPEKGISQLIDAWSNVPGVKLRVVGEGPLRAELTSRAPANVEFVGALPANLVREAMSSASFLIIPSISYEGFPLVVAEAFSVGLPVLASAIGSLKELISEGRNGRFFIANDALSLAAAANEMAAEAPSLRANARLTYEESFTPTRNLQKLTEIYNDARTIASAAGGI